MVSSPTSFLITAVSFKALVSRSAQVFKSLPLSAYVANRSESSVSDVCVVFSSPTMLSISRINVDFPVPPQPFKIRIFGSEYLVSASARKIAL